MKSFDYQANIDPKEVLRYLGCQTGGLATLAPMLEECIGLSEKTVRPKFAMIKTALSPSDEDIFCDCGITLPGKDIAAHLKGCREAAIFAATVGIEMDRLIARHTLSDMTRCVILDACGTAVIEDYCDEIEQHLRMQLTEEGLFLTSRFSCGYGDLPIALQPLILEKTDAYRRALISCNESFMLIPLKSVSAIMGISDAPTARTKCKKNCKDCSLYETCPFKRND